MSPEWCVRSMHVRQAVLAARLRGSLWWSGTYFGCTYQLGIWLIPLPMSHHCCYVLRILVYRVTHRFHSGTLVLIMSLMTRH